MLIIIDSYNLIVIKL